MERQGSVETTDLGGSEVSGDELSERSTHSSSTNAEARLTRSASDKRRKKKASTAAGLSPYAIQYKSVNIFQAAREGNLPLCVLLWGMASAKKVNLLAPDAQGNNALHAGALADSPEVITFLLQQVKGEESKLLESRNLIGETPLLCAMSSGVPVVVKTLIDNGSDPLTSDAMGSSVFTKLAKSGHLWCLHFVYCTICDIHGPQVALELMSSVDNDAHSPLDWAADAGDVNIIEFFIRKGLNPYRCDAFNRTALYWAVKSNRVEAARFLVLCGCDPLQLDVTSESPMSVAKANKNPALIEALSLQSPHTLKSNASINDLPFNIAALGCQGRSNAIYQHNRSRLGLTILFCSVFIFFWVLTVFLPFYAWAVFFVGCAYVYRKIQVLEKSTKENIDPSPKDFGGSLCSFQRTVLNSPEKGLGFWMASMLLFGVYLMSSFYSEELGHENDASADYSILERATHHNPFHVGGIRGAKGNEWLLWLTTVFLLVASVFWIKVVWMHNDPGIVNTRLEDFDEVMTQSLRSGGPPPSSEYCRTTLVRKPLRSKFCPKTGAVVARMDHYCIWLNITVGFGNHRSFLILLLSQFVAAALGALLTVRGLFLDLKEEKSCSTLPTLLSREYFFTVVLCVVLICASIGLGALAFDQCYNIVHNITTNERINGSRYPWMVSSEGCFSNRFDRGWFVNVLEFFQVPGYGVNYFATFELPSDLTQENIRLNSSRLRPVGGGENFFTTHEKPVSSLNDSLQNSVESFVEDSVRNELV